MTAGEYCTRDVIIAEASESIRVAVDLMRKEHVGDIVVVSRDINTTKPVGILTDRDIVIDILANKVEIDSVSIGDVMSYELITVDENTKLLDAIKIMRTRGVRRLPVINNKGELLGILSADDVIELLSELLSDLSALITKERKREFKIRR